MKKLFLLAAAVSLLAGCKSEPVQDSPEPASENRIAAPSPSEPSAEAPADPPPAIPEGEGYTAVAAPADIVGEWRAAGVNGEDVGARQSFAITLEATGTELKMTSQCVWQRYVYTLDNGRFAARRWSFDRDAAAGEEVPPPMCARALTLDEAAFERAMLGANAAYRDPSNALVFAGPEGRVTLYTQ